MTLAHLLKTLGHVLSDTSLVEDACRLLGDIRAAREVAASLLIEAIGQCSESQKEILSKKIRTAIVERTPFEPILQEIDDYFPLKTETITAKAKAYICKSREKGNVLARDFSSSRGSPYASLSENSALVMIEWLMAALTFEERQVLLLLRFRDASPRSVAADLGIEEPQVRTHARQARKKLAERKKETIWQSPERCVPDWREFQGIYETCWEPSVRKLAYYLLGDVTGAARITDTVRLRAQQEIEEHNAFDRDTAWQGNNDFIGFKRHTFKAVRKFLIELKESDKADARAQRPDVWAQRVQRLNRMETQVFLLSTFFFQPNNDGIHEIAVVLAVDPSTVKINRQQAVEKMLQREER